MKRFGLMLILGFLITFLSGCHITASPYSLIHTPMQPQGKQELKDAIFKQIPKKAKLVSPGSSKIYHQIVLNDFDGDHHKEALFFYYTGYGDDHMAIMKLKKNHWKKVLDVSTGTVDVDEFLVDDINHDGIPEIIVGDDLYDHKECVVYSFKNGKLKEQFKHPYSKIVINDLNDDHQKDLTLINLTPLKNFTVSTYQVNKKGSYQELSSIKLDADIDGIDHVEAGKLTQNESALFIETATGNVSNTEVVSFHNGKLVQTLPENEQTDKPFPEYSKDINHDGIIDIAVPFEPKGWEDEPLSNMPYITAYKDWNGKQLKVVNERYNSYQYGFYVEFPNSWINRVTIKHEKINKHVTFITINNKKPLLTVYWINKSKSYNKKHFIKIGESPKYIYLIPNKKTDINYRYTFHIIR
ncbi:hypothetical protein [Scopulibacillus cellulosilyticus]|uniref:VCBS repeat protein n=1 Tax=Scopulibacillus cellulosilyticus TaxID=2665665 RepID=A0ABW2PSA2_9BACL